MDAAVVEPVDDVLSDEDHAGTKKSDAGDDPSGDPGRIDRNMGPGVVLNPYVEISVNGGAEATEQVGAQAGALRMVAALVRRR